MTLTEFSCVKHSHFKLLNSDLNQAIFNEAVKIF